MNLITEVNVMQIAIHANDFKMTEGIRDHIDRKLRFALERIRLHVKSVSIRLGDVNGPKGGRDKRCLLTVSLTNTQEVVVDDTQADMYQAIDSALRRLSRVAKRKIDRVKKRNRQATKVVNTKEFQDIDIE